MTTLHGKGTAKIYELEALAQARNYYRWVFEEFEPYLRRRVLEVGAGLGGFTSYLLTSRASHVFALEPSVAMCARLRERFQRTQRLTVLHGTLDGWVNALPGAEAVVYVNVLEHIEDDRQELNLARNLLAPQGHLCLFVPAMKRLYGVYDALVGHYRRYDGPPLRQLLKDAGFEVVQQKYLDLVGVFPWWILFKFLRRREFGGRTVKLYDRVVPLVRLLESKFRLPFGKNMIIIGRKA
jgi:SAM-dependent methyltransferase